MSNYNPDVAAALAKALKAKGIESDVPEAEPNPFWAAQQAFFICHGRDGRAWLKMEESRTAESIPPAVYHRKLAEFCRRALRHPLMPDDLREPVTYAWGYFRGHLKAENTKHLTPTNASDADV